jgi:predicted outer membrane repeat protein
MYTTGILLVAAQGAHTVVMVHDLFFEYIFNTTAYTTGEVPQISYGSLNADSNPSPIMTITDLFTNTSSAFFSTNGADGGGGGVYVPSNCVNTGVYISNYTANYTSGNSTAKITVVYSVITTTS